MQSNAQENLTTASEDVQAKRMDLLGGKGQLGIGRRESPQAGPDPAKRRLYVRGIVLGAVVVAAALALVLVLGGLSPLG